MRNYFRKLTFLTLFLFILANFSFAQNGRFPVPREEKLLNGLKVLMWRQAKTGRVTVKLRVHSGSAFDPKGKEGTIALLGDVLFPEEAIKKFFEEELEGKLEVVSNYDYVQINASAKSSEFLALMQTLSSAVSRPQIDRKTVAKIKTKRLEMLKKLEQDIGYIADRAVAERLFGDYPYGRSQMGTTESMTKIDFADLLFASKRFLTSDNATLTITGDFKLNYGYKVARRLFGGWQKSLMKIPANFRIPEKPETTPHILNTDFGTVIENRYALAGVSRKSKDFVSAQILSQILNKRFVSASKQKGLISASVKNRSNFLRGYIVFSKQLNPDDLPMGLLEIAPSKGSEERMEFEHTKFITDLFVRRISETEFANAKTNFMESLAKSSVTEAWLNAETYEYQSASVFYDNAKTKTLEDIQTLASRLKDNKIVDVSIQPIKSDLLPKSVTDKDPDDPKK